jgi:GDP-4-dehydro-6-deoxy-D-mannose reductase
MPRRGSLPLGETADIAPRGPYGLAKAGQEGVALELSRALGVRAVVTRSFNHTGPGQRPDFAVPAFASRILAAHAAGERAIRVGNVDVRRDLTDVRDVVRAYRLLLELAAAGDSPTNGLVVNVASGASVAIRDVISGLSAAAGTNVDLVVDAALVRDDDPPDIYGDPALLRSLTGWRPRITLEQTLSDLLESLGWTTAPR